MPENRTSHMHGQHDLFSQDMGNWLGPLGTIHPHPTPNPTHPTQPTPNILKVAEWTHHGYDFSPNPSVAWRDAVFCRQLTSHKDPHRRAILGFKADVCFMAPGFRQATIETKGVHISSPVSFRSFITQIGSQGHFCRGAPFWRIWGKGKAHGLVILKRKRCRDLQSGSMLARGHEPEGKHPSSMFHVFQGRLDPGVGVDLLGGTLKSTSSSLQGASCSCKNAAQSCD